MNKIFKVIWSKSKQCYVVVSEIAKNKTGKKKIVVAGIFAALAMVSSVQDVSAVTGSGGTNNFSNSGSGASFKEGEGLAIGTNATVANGNTNTVAIGVSSEARGSSSFAASGGTTAAGKAGQVAIGWSSTDGTGAVAIGGTTDTAGVRDTRATGTSAVALGIKSAATGNNAFAASGGNATGESATAIGSNAIASGRGGVAVGWNAESAVNAVGIGFNAKAKSNNTVAIGVEANSDNGIGDNFSSVSIGVKTRAREVGSMAMGVSADASGKYSIALGSGNVSGDYTATANYPKATGEKSIAIGYNSNSSNTGATAIGAGATASGADSFAGGSGTAGGNSSIAIGKGASITTPTAGTTVGGQDSIAMGTGATANQHSSVTIGAGSTSDGVRNITIGPKASASGVDSIAIGNGGVGGDKNNTGVGGNGNTYTINVNDISTNVYYGVKSVDNGSIAFGNRANAAKGGLAIGTVSIADGGIAVGQSVLSKNGVAMGSAVSATVANAVAMGSTAEASSIGAVAIGGYSATDKTKAQGNNALAIGASAVTNGSETIAIGKSANASNANAVAVGKNANASIANSVAIGSDSTTDTNATRQANTTINGITYNFAGATSDAGMQVSVGAAGKERQIKNVAAGEVSATSTDAINGSQLFAVASQIKPIQYFAVNSSVAGNKDNSGAIGSDSVAIGPKAKAQAVSSIALGNNATAAGGNSIAIGNTSSATDKQSPISIGYGATANGDFSIAIGGGDNNTNYGATANGVGGTSLGGKTKTTGGNFQTAVGFGATTTAQNASAFGYNATTSVEGGVALGFNSSSTTGVNKGYNPNDNRTNKYDGLKNNVLTSTTGAIAVGNGSTVTRQITGLAAGTKDTDAVNVAQLKSVNLAFKGNVGSGDVNLATNDSDKKLTIQGDRTYITTNASGNTLTISANKKDINVTNGTARADAGMADAKNVAEAINKAVSQNAYTWNLTADNDTAGSRATINKEGTVKFSGDSNITVARNNNTITTSLNKSIIVNSVKANNNVTVGTNKITLDGTTGAVTGKAFTGDSFTAGNNVLTNTTLQIGSPAGGNNVSITRDGLIAKAGTKTVKFATNGIDAGGQQITNVSSGGNVGTNAANITDVKNRVSDVTLNLDTNSKTGTVKLSESPLKVIGANGIRTDLVGTNNGSLVVGLDSNTVNATTKGIGLTGDTGSTGFKYLKDGDASFKVAGDGKLVTTKASATGVQVAVDTAKVKDLVVEAVTVSKANTADNPITVTPTAGTNSKDYAIGIDTTKLASKTDLTYRANNDADANAQKVSLAKGLNFVNGDNTVATVAADGKVSYDLNAATKTKIDDSATAVARNISFGADSGTASSQSLKDGDVAFNVKGATGDLVSTKMNGNTVEISTKRAAITSDANTGAASVTGDDGLATSKNVADAINKAADAAKAGAAWNLTTNSSTTDKTTVQGGDTVDLINGDNILITQDGTDKKKITVATKKDLTVDSITAGNTVMNTSGLTNGTTAITGTGITTDKVTVGGISIDKTDGINGGNKTITNVASGGTTDTNAANIGDVKQAVANLSQNLNITDGTNNGTIDLKNQKLNVAGTNGVTATVNGQTVTVGLDDNTVNATTKGIGLTGDTGSTGNKYLKDGDVSFAVVGDGNLVSTSATATGVKVTVDAAKVKDLAVDAVTVSKDAQADNPITVTPTAGTNSKDYAIGIDTTKLAGKTDLTYRANNDTDANAQKVSLAKGLNFINGDTTVATVAADGKVSYDINTATKTKINDAATAVARNISLGADSGTASSQSLKDNDVAFNVKGATGDYISTKMNGDTVEVSTKHATINSDAAGTASVTGNDGLATAKNVADAINKAASQAKDGAAWKLSANGDTPTTVAGGDTVDFTGDNNITVTQTGKNIATILNKDLKDLSTISLTNLRGESIFLDGGDGTIKAYKAEFKDNNGAGSSINSDILRFTNGATGANAVETALSLDVLSIQAGPNNSALTSRDLTFLDEDKNTSYQSAQGIVFQSAAGKTIQFTLDEINAGGNKIKEVAEGTDDTDAVNVKQLKDTVASQTLTYRANSAADTDAKSVKLSKGLDFVDGTMTKATVDNDGKVTFDINDDTKTKINDSAAAVNRKVSLGADSGTASSQSLKDGDVAFNVKGATGDFVSTKMNGDTVEISTKRATIDSNATTGAASVTGDDGLATAKNVADAINAAKKASKTEITANAGEAANATKGNVTLTSTTAVDGHTIYDVKLNDKVTLGTGTNAVTIDGTAGKATIGSSIVDGVNNTFTTGGTKAVTLDGATGTITGKTANIGGVTVNGTANTIGGLSNTTWNGTAVSGRAATEDQLKAATGATTLKFTGDVATNTGSVNLKDDTFGIKGDGKYISSDVNGKNVNLTVSEAEVKKSAVAAVTVSTDTTDANNPLTVTPTTSADGTTKDYKVTIDGTKIANKTNVSYKANGGTAKQVSLADGLNFKNGTLTTASIDDAGVVKYDVNTAAITAGADGTITGPTTDGVATAKNVADAINTAKKASKTEITANTGEAANATKGNVTLTSTTAADGHTIYDVKLNDKVTLGSGANAVTVDGTAGKAIIGTAVVNGVANTITTGGANAVTLDGATAKVTAGVTTVDGTTGTITTGGTNSIKVDGATGTVTGLTNKDWTPGITKAVTGRAATEDQLQKVADAASSQTWNITADKTGTTGAQTGTKKNATVGKDETVELVAGDNLTINQNERKFTYSLNKDLAGLTSVSVGTGTTETIKLDGATGKITAKNAVIGGVTVDGDNSHVTGLSNTTWNGTVITGRAATEDQLKAVADTAKATTDAVNLKFSGDTNTSAGVVNLKDDTFNIVGDGKYVSTDANGKNLTVKVSEAEVKKSAVAAVTVSTDTTDANNPLTVTPTTSADGTTKDYKVTIDGTKIANKTNLSYKANDGTAKQVSLADGLNFKNGTLTTASIDDAGVVKYDVNTAAITAGTDGTITGPTTDGVATAKNVADAINAAKKAAKTEITANAGEAANATTGNVTLTSTTAADGHTIYDVKLNDKVTLGTGANAVTVDGTTGAITGKTATIGGVTVNGTANTIGGLSNTTWNGTATTGRAATEDQLKAVADAAGSQTWEITADKKAGTSGAQTGTKKNAKVGKDDKVQLIAGENMTVNQNERDFTFTLNKDLVKMNSARFLGTGSNTTVITGNSITQTAGTQTNTSTAAGNTIANGTKSTETTAAGQVIKDGNKSNKSTVDSNVIDDGNGNKNTSNATSNTITDGTNTTEVTASTVTVKDNAGNSTVITKDTITTGTGANKVTVDGTAGKVTAGTAVIDGVNNSIITGGANTIKLDGASGTVTGLTNKTWTPGITKAVSGRAATEDQLQQVSDAVGAGWKVNTGTVVGSSGVSNGAASTKVSSGEEVKLQAGDNLVIDQNGKTVSYSLNKDLTKMNSATFEATGGKTTVIKGDSIVQTDGGKTNTSNAAGNTVVDGNKSTATTAAGTTITDGAKTNTSTADKNVINDGAGNTNVSIATSNTLKNAAGDETKADAKGVTVKDAAGNNATFTKDGITITKTGKDTVSLTSNGLDNGNNKIVNVAAGVANTDAVNVGQLKEYSAKSTTELTANNGETAGSTKGNIVLTKTIAADGHTIYDNKLNDKITLGAADPTKAVIVDGTAGTITVADKITLNGKDGKTGIGTVDIDGKDGIITTGGTNSVKVDGSTGTVTGLTNKTWTPGSIVSGRAATEDQLKEALADSGWKAAVDKEGSGQSTVVGTSPEKIKAEETVTFKAGNNMMVTQTGKSISYAVNPELTDMKSATFKDAAGNTTVTNGNGITITPGSANPTNPHAGPVSLTKDGLNNGNNQIKGVAPGTDSTDAVNVSQLNASNANTSQAINQIAGEVQHVGAHAAAMAALKPIQYDPLEPTQVMAGVGNYRGETAAALGLAHYTNENTMFNVGVSVGGNHNMVNAGVTHKFGYSPEKKNIPDRYKAGPISSMYVMQDEVSSLKKENAEQKYVIADQAARLTTLEAENEQQRRELAETKQGLDDLKAAVDKLLASKG